MNKSKISWLDTNNLYAEIVIIEIFSYWAKTLRTKLQILKKVS